MTVMEAIQGRRSIRRYADRKVEPEKLAQVLEAGRLAPTARNAQTLEFHVVQSEELRRQMVDACNGQPMVGEAPAVLIVCGYNDRKMACGQSTVSLDGSIALSFMMLEAHALGLGTCWLGNFDSEKVRRLLKLPDDRVLVAVTPLGYPAEQPAARSRKSPEEICFYDDEA